MYGCWNSEEDVSESLVYSYTKSFNAFAAKLSEDEATQLSSMDEVLSVFPNQYRKLHTTKSWEFIGLTPSSKRKFNVESSITIGLLDTGKAPSAESLPFHFSSVRFKDRYFSPCTRDHSTIRELQ